MKQSTIDQLSWQDVQEIVTEAYLMHTIPEDLAMFETPEEQYTELIDRLKRRAVETNESCRQALLRSYYGD